MTAAQSAERYLTRHPAVAALSYIAAALSLVAVIWVSLADLYDSREAMVQANDLLSRLEAQRQAPQSANSATTVPTGSPFLEGRTVTIAGAALLQRVATAITRYGGNVLSSQVELHGPQAKDGFVSLVVSCEVTQPNLQRLLYNLEAGMPFLFVDQLVASAPRASVVAEGGKMQVLLAVSGQWQGTK